MKCRHFLLFGELFVFGITSRQLAESLYSPSVPSSSVRTASKRNGISIDVIALIHKPSGRCSVRLEYYSFAGEVMRCWCRLFLFQISTAISFRSRVKCAREASGVDDLRWIWLLIKKIQHGIPVYLRDPSVCYCSMIDSTALKYSGSRSRPPLPPPLAG